MSPHMHNMTHVYPLSPFGLPAITVAGAALGGTSDSDIGGWWLVVRRPVGPEAQIWWLVVFSCLFVRRRPVGPRRSAGVLDFFLGYSVVELMRSEGAHL